MSPPGSRVIVPCAGSIALTPADDFFLQVVRLDVGFPGHQLAGEAGAL